MTHPTRFKACLKTVEGLKALAKEHGDMIGTKEVHNLIAALATELCYDINLTVKLSTLRRDNPELFKQLELFLAECRYNREWIKNHSTVKTGHFPNQGV